MLVCYGSPKGSFPSTARPLGRHHKVHAAFGAPDIRAAYGHFGVNCTKWTKSASAPAAAPAATSGSAPAQASGTYSGGGGFASCVIARESGGNSQVMNSSGHYGLYQFSASTWQAYGGSAASFGHASVSEQNRVFNNAMAQGGQSNWSPYDGC